MGFLSLGKINKNIIPIFMGSLFSILFRLITKIDDVKLFTHQIISNLLTSTIELFIFIPLIIEKIKSNKESNRKYLDINNIKLIFKDDSNKQKYQLKKGRFKYILLSGIIFFTKAIIFAQTIEIKTNTWILNILLNCTFYYLIFKLKLYRHHYLSIILIIFIGIIHDLCYENIQNDLSSNWILFLLKVIKEIFFPLEAVINKYLMEKKFCSVYLLTTCNGIIVTSLFGMFSILDYYYFKLDNFQEYFDNFNYKEFLVIIGFMIIQLGFYLSLMFTNKHNTPCHLFIIFTFGELVNNINLSIASLITIICFIFIMFISLVFNEIIEINCCGLELNTKRNIIKRALDEEFNMIHNNIIIDDDSENDSNNNDGNNVDNNNNDDENSENKAENINDDISTIYD